MLKRDAAAKTGPYSPPRLLRRSATRRAWRVARPSMRHGVLLAIALLAALGTACGASAEPPSAVFSSSTPIPAVATSAASTTTSEPSPSPSPTPETPTPAETPEPTSTPAPAVARAFTPVEAQIVTATVSRAAPSMSSRAVGDLPAFSRVSLVAEERGEGHDRNWGRF